MHHCNSIALRRKSKVFIARQKENSLVKTGLIGALIGNVSRFGYVLEPALIHALQATNDEFVIQFHQWIEEELREKVGARDYRPMYRNFPKQVANASDEELFVNAILHYFGDWVGLRILPEYEVEVRAPLIEVSKLKPIGLLSEKEFDNLLNELVGAKSSPSDQDKKDMLELAKAGFPIALDTVPNRETLAFILAHEWTKDASSRNTACLLAQVKTATDVLRLAVAMSGGDLSLAEDSNFIKFKRSYRRFLLELIERLPAHSLGEDMMRYRQKWRRLGEVLHPGDFSGRFPKTYEAFRAIRNEGAETFNRRVESFIRAGQWDSASELLSKRPGELARRLDHLLRSALNPQQVIDQFAAVAAQVSTPVLWQVHAHFMGRIHLVGQERVFFPKGNTAKPLMGYNLLPELPLDIRLSVVEAALNGIRAQYAKLPILGKVYIDPVCDGMVVPSGNRSASAALRTVGRGSRFPITKDTVRLFMWWRNQPGSRVDLDLSAILYARDWGHLGEVSFRSLRYDRDTMIHSGDITSAPNGASEYMDINLPKLLDRNPGIGFIAITVTSYTGQKLSDLNEAFAGWMEREYPGDGEIYEPATVMSRADLRAPSTMVCPLIVDVDRREIVWGDFSLQNEGRCQTVDSAGDAASQGCRAIAQYAYTRPVLADVFKAHVEARQGDLVSAPEGADLVVSETGDVSPFDAAKIMSQFF